MSFETTTLHSAGGYIGRLIRLDLTVFDEIRSDPAASPSAILAVFGASVMAGIGSWLWAVQTDNIKATEVFIRSLVIGSILQTLVWLIWVYLVFQILARAYGARTDFSELIRTMGFAFTPVAASILVAITAFAVPLGVVSITGAVLLTHFAVQSSSSAEPRQVLLSNFVGFLTFAVVIGVLANVAEISGVGGVAPGLFFFALDL